MKKIIAFIILSIPSILFSQPFSQALSFDDVLLVPKRSSIHSRKEASTKTKLTRNLFLYNPLISANMDTVTESGMAIKMAELGGVGVIHRFNCITRQAEEVRRVKRYTNAFIENPLTIHPNDTLQEAHVLMKSHGITGLLVVDEQRKLVGILTQRDMWFPQTDLRVLDRMTSREKLIIGKPDITIPQAKTLLLQHRIEKLPIVYDDGTVAGLITSKDIYKKNRFPHASLDQKGRLLVGAAIGVKETDLDRAQALIDAGVDFLVIDIAHGHSDLALNMIKDIKRLFPGIDVIAGNIATAQAVHDLIEAGADAVKVGVGPGSICTTRITTGCGYPQLSAILACAQEAHKYGIPIIADGGIRSSGDIAKALAAGAHTVMLGSLLAGTEESPGLPFMKQGKKFKVVRGMASFGARLGREVNEHNNDDFDQIGTFVPEGVEAVVPYKGKVVEVISQLIGGLLSGMSYCGAVTIDELHEQAEFVQITFAGLKESHSHDVVVM